MSLASILFDVVVHKRQVAASGARVGAPALSADLTVEPILALIPFFSVGITGFATFSVSLAMSRVSMVSLYTYAAVLAAFIGALLDLGQQLVRGASNVRLGLGIDAVRGFLVAREIFLSLSFGFRFIFYWATVAEGYGRQGKFDTTHFASWDRWGWLGFILKYLTLAGTFAVPALQVVWRLGSGNSPSFTSVYIAESTFQITLSALFLLKVGLTFVVSPPSQRIQALQHYALLIMALLTSLAIGIGSLIFGMAGLFSETTLGRFLQSTEMYMMLLFVLALSFQARNKARPRSSFQGLGMLRSEKPGLPDDFLNPPPRIPTPDYISNRTPREVEQQRQRTSLARLSSWIAPRPAPRAPSPPFSSTQDLELGISIPKFRSIPTVEIEQVPRGDDAPIIKSLRDISSPAPRYRPEPPRLDSAPLTLSNADPVQGASPVVAPLAPATPEHLLVSPIPQSPPPQSPLPLTPPPPPRSPTPGTPDSPASAVTTRPLRPVTDISLASYYKTNRNSLASSIGPPPKVFGREQTDSPIYGLNGILKQLPTLAQPEGTPTPPRRSSNASFDQLLKEQQALDNSIRLLQLFSPQDGMSFMDTTEDNASSLPPRAIKAEESDRLTVQSSTQSQSRVHLDSMSARSEFSLSVFPDPPEGADAPVVRVRRVVEGPRSPLSFQDRFSSVDPPNENDGNDGGSNVLPSTARLDSMATQYDVTSFIGGLSNPLSDAQVVSFTRDSTIVDKPGPSLRPLLLPTTAQEVRSVPYNPPRDSYKPLMLRVRAPAPRRSMISGPRPPRLDEESETDFYERPRVPPNVSNTNP